MMNDLDQLYAKRGDSKRAKFNALLAWLADFARSQTLRSGEGVRLQRNSQGTTVIADSRATAWEHPWRVSLGKGTAQITPGTVNAQVPMIDGVALDAARPPTLKLTGSPNESKRSWIALRVLVDAAGELIKTEDNDDAITIVHVNDLVTTEARTALHPLAMLVWRDKSTVAAVHAITLHDLQHAVTKTADGKLGKHWFWPA